jgi:Glycosyl transferase family 2.
MNQSFKDFEYIIIDGISNDETLNIIKKYENKIHNLF